MVCKTCFYNNFTKSKQLKLIFALLAVELGYFFAFENPSMESIFIGLGLASAGGSKTVSLVNIGTGLLLMAHNTTIADYSQPTSATGSSGNSVVTESTATHKDETQDDQAGLFGGSAEGMAEKLETDSVLIGVQVSKLGMFIRKRPGQSPTGTVTFAVLDVNNAVLFSFGTLLAESLTTSYQWIEKENLTGYTLSVDERVGVKFTGGDSSNRLDVSFHVVGSFDTTKTVSTLYDAGWVETSGRETTFRLYIGTAEATNIFDDPSDPTANKWESDAEINPKVYVDIGSSKNICGIAIHLHANTTETEIKIRVSSDATFTDSENVRTITMTKLTAGQWNYIRCSATLGRYIELFGSSGSSLVLAINEIKIYTVTDSILGGSHGHLSIDATDTAIGLDGT